MKVGNLFAPCTLLILPYAILASSNLEGLESSVLVIKGEKSSRSRQAQVQGDHPNHHHHHHHRHGHHSKMRKLRCKWHGEDRHRHRCHALQHQSQDQRHHHHHHHWKHPHSQHSEDCDKEHPKDSQHRHHHHHHEEKQIHPHPEDSGPSKEVTSGEEMNVNSPEEVAGREGKDQASGKGPVSPPLPVSEPHIPINNGTDHGNPFNDKEEGGDGDGDGNEDVDDADDVSDSPSSPPWNDDDRVAKPPSPKHGGNVGSGGGGGGTPPPSSKPSNDVKSLLGNLFSGQGTFFTPGLGACGETDDEGSMIVAVSDDIFSKYNRNGNPNLNTLCNAQIRIHYKGKTVLVRATDCCPTCNPTSLDLSPAAFNQLESPDVGVLRGMTWEFTGQ